MTPRTIAHQAPLSMEFPRQECWSGWPSLSAGDLLDPGTEPRSLSLSSEWHIVSYMLVFGKDNRKEGREKEGRRKKDWSIRKWASIMNN